ncbi:hypothetical protein ACL02S_14315 [Nocardia sp. 004]|uniref:hypothetical protein n=1 Tax=Nocardia sp. 004 TaxID=3385978 RepID=UPI0039A15B35
MSMLNHPVELTVTVDGNRVAAPYSSHSSNKSSEHHYTIPNPYPEPIAEYAHVVIYVADILAGVSRKIILDYGLAFYIQTA